METGSASKLHSCHGCSEYDLIRFEGFQQIEFQDPVNRQEWELRYPTLGSDTPKHYIDCVTLVAAGRLKIVERKTISNGDSVDKYTILSHPWTEALTDLVKDTKTLCRNDDGSGYLVRIAENCGGSILEALMELAQCTVSLGVRYMWVDSICLDQCDPESMAYEIGRMYSYYKNSYCTIVCLNGLGKRTNLAEWATTVARWFSRVWTLQEGLVCHEVYFLAAPVTGILARVVTEVIELKKVLASLDDTLTQQVHSTRDTLQVTSDVPKRAKSYEQMCARLRCCCCSVQCSTYYTEEDRHGLDERYICMQQMHFQSHLYDWQHFLLISQWVVNITCTTDETDASIAFESLDALYNFGLSRQTEQPLKVIEILEEVCTRSCSYPEDRVLAVLGILGIGATSTLRSGLLLYDQIKWLCSVATPEVRHALIVKNFSYMYPSMPGSFWMPDLCRPKSGWMVQILEARIGEWDYDIETNRVTGTQQNPFSVNIKEVEEKDAGQIKKEILWELQEQRLEHETDVSWWTITLSFEAPEDPLDKVTVEVLCAVNTKKSGEVWGTECCWLGDRSVGALHIGDIVGSSNLKNWQVAIADQSLKLVGLPVIEDLVEEEGQPPEYDVGFLLCTGTEERMHKVGGLMIFSSAERDVASFMYRHRARGSTRSVELV